MTRAANVYLLALTLCLLALAVRVEALGERIHAHGIQSCYTIQNSPDQGKK